MILLKIKHLKYLFFINTIKKMATPKNVMSLGDTAKCRQIIASEIGSSSVPVTKIWGFVAGSENLQQTCDVGNQTTTDIIMNGGILHTTKINDNNLDNLYIRGRVGLGVNPADPLVEDVEIDGNVQIDTSGLGKIVFYDKAAGHEHAEFDADDDGTNGGKAIIKVKEDGGSVQTAMAIRQDRVIEFDKIQFRDLNPTNPILIGANTDFGPYGQESVGIGQNCGTNNSGIRQVSIGFNAGRNSGGSRCVCIGDQTGETNAGDFSVNIGANAAEAGSGSGAVVIGCNAGRTQADDNCIILNATVSNLDSAGSDRCYIAPLRQNQTNTDDEVVCWDNDGGTFELTHSRLKPSITQINALPGGSYSSSSATKTISIIRWTPGSPGTFTYNLPSVFSINQGQRFIIKSFTTDPTQIVEIRPQTGQLIDGSNTPLQLTGSARSTSGGGGSCVELVEYSNQFFIIAAYNQTV